MPASPAAFPTEVIEVERDEILALIRSVHEASKKLATCGDPAIEPRANDILGLSSSLLWSEAPFEAVGDLLEFE
jgi:hypothetical protein